MGLLDILKRKPDESNVWTNPISSLPDMEVTEPIEVTKLAAKAARATANHDPLEPQIDPRGAAVEEGFFSKLASGKLFR